MMPCKIEVSSGPIEPAKKGVREPPAYAFWHDETSDEIVLVFAKLDIPDEAFNFERIRLEVRGAGEVDVPSAHVVCAPSLLAIALDKDTDPSSILGVQLKLNVLGYVSISLKQAQGSYSQCLPEQLLTALAERHNS